MPFLERLKKSVVSVMIELIDYKDIYSYHLNYIERNGELIVSNVTGFAFIFDGKIYVISDYNIFNSCDKYGINYNIKIQFYSENRILNGKIIDKYCFNNECFVDENVGYHYLNNNNKIPGYFCLILLQDKVTMHSIMHFSELAKYCGNNYFGYNTNIFGIGNPFGVLCPSVLNNSVIHGQIKQVLNQYYYVANMKLIPGFEGGIVYTNNNNNNDISIVGIVSCGVYDVTKSLTIILHFGHLLNKLFQIFNINASNKIITYKNTCSTLNNRPIFRNHVSNVFFENKTGLEFDKLNEKLKQVSMDNVIPIKIGNHWGSGLLLNNHGHILTNAHIIRPYLLDKKCDILMNRLKIKENHQIKIGIWNDDYKYRIWKLATLIYISHVNSPNDIAWLRLKNKLNDKKCVHVNKIIHHKKDYQYILNNNENVYVIGYGIYNPINNINPLVTNGCLSKIICDDNNDSKVNILRSSCDVYSGHSGGILSDINGQILGIITNNIVFDFHKNMVINDTWEKLKYFNKYNSNNKHRPITYPSLNLILPFNILYPLYNCINDFIKNGYNVDNDLNIILSKYNDIFMDLDKENEFISAQWNLISKEKLQKQIDLDDKMQKIKDLVLHSKL